MCISRVIGRPGGDAPSDRLEQPHRRPRGRDHRLHQRRCLNRRAEEPSDHPKGLRPWRTRIRITTTAMTNSRWMNPPIVYEETSPSSHRMTRMTAMVSSICFSSTREVAPIGIGINFPATHRPLPRVAILNQSSALRSGTDRLRGYAVIAHPSMQVAHATRAPGRPSDTRRALDLPHGARRRAPNLIW